MASAALLLDEDVRVVLAAILRQRGDESSMCWRKSDPEQLAYAVQRRRAILTHNICDYVLLHRAYQAQGKAQYGILTRITSPCETSSAAPSAV